MKFILVSGEGTLPNHLSLSHTHTHERMQVFWPSSSAEVALSLLCGLLCVAAALALFVRRRRSAEARTKAWEDPKLQCEAIYHHLCCYEFPWECFYGINFAFYAPSPRPPSPNSSTLPVLSSLFVFVLLLTATRHPPQWAARHNQQLGRQACGRYRHLDACLGG